jgi:uncharacterized protein YukE
MAHLNLEVNAMSRQLIVESDAVSQFVRDLRQYADALESNTLGVKRRLGTLSDTWRDQKYREFEADMVQITERVKQSCATVQMYAQHLQRFAEKVREAENSRIGR